MKKTYIWRGWAKLRTTRVGAARVTSSRSSSRSFTWEV